MVIGRIIPGPDLENNCLLEYTPPQAVENDRVMLIARYAVWGPDGDLISLRNSAPCVTCTPGGSTGWVSLVSCPSCAAMKHPHG